MDEMRSISFRRSVPKSSHPGGLLKIGPSKRDWDPAAHGLAGPVATSADTSGETGG